MKTFGGVLLVAACFVACAHSFPGPVQDDSDERFLVVYPRRDFEKSLPTDPFENDPLDSFSWAWPNWYTRMSDLIKNLMPWPESPKGTNTTSTTNIINGHVVTVNESTYSDGDDEFGIRIRVRVVEIQPQNETIPETERGPNTEGTTGPTKVATEATPSTSQEERTTPARSVETLEEFDNDIPKNQVETLTA
ncbi:icarapin-like [Lasioglossum baleicum]|uniref:icarapin-like n=1 Tax=Lasioglossum baleicum TaxID=434251 RepID=UPI003FCC810A